MTSAEHAPTVVEQSVLDDLRARLRAYRRVEVPTGFGWLRGVNGDHLANLIVYWADAHNWREHETRLLGLPWDLIGDNDTPIRAVHLRRRKPTPFLCCSFTVPSVATGTPHSQGPEPFSGRTLVASVASALTV